MPRIARLAAIAAFLALAPGAVFAQQPATPPEVAEPQGPPAPPVGSRPQLVVEAETGAVLTAVNPHLSWHPASLTKMMTVYVALDAMRRGRVSPTTMLPVSVLAARQVPSKMGLRPGSRVSLEAALYILMVKSANDVAVTVAEGVSGGVPAFVEEMNATSRRLGMTATVWRNPNGLHHPEQVTTARDLAVLARALYRDFPEARRFFGAPAIQFGEATMRNYNPLIGRYPGADGLKTGFICASGFNLVASATRSGRRLIGVVLGEQSARARGERAAFLLDQAWNGGGLFSPDRGRLETMVRPAALTYAAPNLRQEICVERRGRAASESEDTETAPPPVMMLSEGQSPSVATPPGTPADSAGAAVANATGQRPSLLAPLPPQVQAVVLGRSVIDRRNRQPMRVAVVGTATVGQGLPVPPAAMTAMTEPGQSRTPAIAAAAGAPVALVPTPPPRPRHGPQPAARR